MAGIHKEGKAIIWTDSIIFGAIAVLFIVLVPNPFIKWTVAAICVALIAFLFIFFRVPDRKPVTGEGLVVSPADGKVVSISEVEDPEYLQGRLTKISVYLNLFSVHITWFPVGGRCVYYKYHPGKYLFAWLPKSSDKNEHSTTVIETSDGKQVMFRQIAGIIARRIVCYCKEDEEFAQGSEAGFIKFGSRADIFIPVDGEVRCKVGDKVIGTQSVLAKI
jgi:phosphatidylserine decarboxylase